MSKSKWWLWITLIVIAVVAVVFIIISSTNTSENKDTNTMEQMVQYETVNVVPDLQIQFPEEVVINTKAEWEHYFSVASPVDMNEFTIIGYNMGQKPNSGYYIEVEDVIEMKDRIVVKANSVSPGENCLTLQVISYPSSFISIPKTAKTIEWEFTSIIDECE